MPLFWPARPPLRSPSGRQEIDVSRTKTQTSVRTRAEFDVALRQVQLTSLEENVLRMRYGIALAADAPLHFHGDESAELGEELAAIERRALQALDTKVDTQRLSSIIDRMRRI